MSPSASTSDSFSDHTVLTEGIEDRQLKWTRAWRRRAYRAWPPPNGHSYPVWKRSRLDQLATAHFTATTDPSMAHGERSREVGNLPADSSLPAMWQQLADAKVQTLEIRSQIRRTRNRALQARRERDAADNTFMSAIRPLCVPSPAAKATAITIDPAHVRDLFQRMQETRNDCQLHELSLEDLEASRQDTQDQLDRLERQLINYQLSSLTAATTSMPLRHPPPAREQSVEPATPSGLSQPDLLLSLEIEPDKTSHPLYQQLMTTFNTLGVERDRRAENFKRKAEIEEQNRHLELIRRYHPAVLPNFKPPREGDLEFLVHFDVQDNKVVGEMQKLSAEVDQLVRLCWERDLLPRHTPLEEVQRWYRPTSDDNLDLPCDLMVGGGTKPCMGFSILLADPRTPLKEYQVAMESASKQDAGLGEGCPPSEAAMRELSVEGPDAGAGKGDKLDYIENWLLHILRTSAHEVGILYSTFLMEGHVNVIDIDNWQLGVLQHWRSDEASRRKFEELERSPEASDTSSSSLPSWYSEPLFLYTESSDVEMELGLKTETEPRLVGRDENSRCGQDSDSEMSLPATTDLETQVQTSAEFHQP